MRKGRHGVGASWNGATFRARLQNEYIAHGFPKECDPVWFGNVVVLVDAKNFENATAFQNCVLLPENAVPISSFARYANGITGSVEFMPKIWQPRQTWSYLTN